VDAKVKGREGIVIWNIMKVYHLVNEQIVEDLVDFSGLSREYILKHFNGKNNFTHSYEYKMRNPKNDLELEWFYITSEKYLFANAFHENWKLIDMVQGNKILDYGGGAGVDTFYLAKKGCNVHYFDISIIQREFVKFRTKKHSIENITVIEPYCKSNFDSINCISETYDGILVRNILEHVPYYVNLVKHLLSKLNSGGVFYEASNFGPTQKDPMHLNEIIPLEIIFKECGLELIFQEGIHKCWKKSGH
jgi:2-polyprenyl-3-methyl-5-hydroxy-6-metoxy-1,4-benzoquinol methylase